MTVLQMNNLESLNSAREHLEEHGFKARVGPLAELPESEQHS